MTIPSHKNNRRYDRAQIEVCGPRLLVRLCTFDYPGPCKLVVVDWWCGEIVTVSLPFRMMTVLLVHVYLHQLKRPIPLQTIDLGQNQGGSLCFLTEDLVLDTCTTGGALRVYQLPELNARKSANSRAVVLSLGLPRLNPEYEYCHDTLCRMRPSPIGALHPLLALARTSELKAWASEPSGEDTSESDSGSGRARQSRARDLFSSEGGAVSVWVAKPVRVSQLLAPCPSQRNFGVDEPVKASFVQRKS
jgi:hypothetical protein